MTLLFDVRELTPTATADQIGDAIALAAAVDARAVCVLPTMLTVANSLHTQLHAETGAAVPISTVAGWPTGAHHTLVKASEARLSVDSGAQEVTVVLNPAAVAAGDATALLSEAVTLRQAVPSPLLLTLGVDVASLPSDGDAAARQVAAAVQSVVPAGADGITLLRSDGADVAVALCAAVKAVLPPSVGLRVDSAGGASSTVGETGGTIGQAGSTAGVAAKNPQAAENYAAAGVGVLALPDPSSVSG